MVRCPEELLPEAQFYRPGLCRQLAVEHSCSPSQDDPGCGGCRSG